jgi:hypothetical protein
MQGSHRPMVMHVPSCSSPLPILRSQSGEKHTPEADLCENCALCLGTGSQCCPHHSVHTHTMTITDGWCKSEDMEEVEKLVLMYAECQIPDFTMEPWATAVLVMPWHSVQTRWNLAALQKYCMKLGNPLYLAPSEDTMGSERK